MDSGFCVFCEDVLKGRKAAIVFEDESTLAFMDYAPVEQGHVLVIPKKHAENILEIDEEYFLKAHLTARKIAPAILSALHADGMNVGQNNGPCANQIVMHYHLHLIPRWCDEDAQANTSEGRFSRKFLNWDRKVVEQDELEAVASIIRKEIKRIYG